MIIWLASYPKSGNTWLRSILGHFFEKDLNEDKVFFNMGVKNDWKILLDNKSRFLIEEKFKNEMTELGYL